MFETGLPTCGSSASWSWDSPSSPWTFSTICSDCRVATLDVEPERMRVVRFECRQEEIIEEEDKSQALDPSAGSDHRWIKKNPHVL
jgi:hypothetical protein